MTFTNLSQLSNLADMAKTGKRKEILSVSIEDVVSKKQVRRRFVEIEALAETISVEGLQSPIIVFPRNQDGKYVIQKGERRWRACKLLGMETVEVIINAKEQTPLDEVAGELIENIQREDLTAMEVAEALQSFAAEGWPNHKIAKRIGKSTSYVSSHLSLLKLPAVVEKLYDEEVCGDTETLNNLRQLYKLDPASCERECKIALTKGITRKHTRELLKKAKEVAKTSSESDEKRKGKHDNATGSVSDSRDNATGSVGDSRDNATGSESGTITELGTTLTNSNVGQEASSTQAEPNQDRSDATNQSWKSVSPGSLVFEVEYSTGHGSQRGRIVTDRLPDSPYHVWIEITDSSDSGESIISVPVSDVKLNNVFEC